MRGFLSRGGMLLGLGLTSGGLGGTSSASGAFVNLGFELAGASPGFASGWSVSIVSSAQGYVDFGASNGDGPKPIEDFERGWGGDAYSFAFQSGDTTVLAFGTGNPTSPIEDFERQWPGVDTFAFALSGPLALVFTGAGQTGIEDFETGWSADTFLFTFGGTTSPSTFGEGIDTETFGDTLVASVVALTGVFTVNAAPDNGTPVAFRAPAPSGITAGTTYYVRDATTGGATFRVAATLGGAAVTIGADGAGFLLDVGARMALAPSQWTAFGISTPGGMVDTEGFESVRGVFSFTVDTATSTLYATGHTFVNGDAITFTGPGLPTSSPDPIVEKTRYTAVNVVAGVSFQVQTTGTLTLTSVAGTGATVQGDPAVFWNETV